MFSKNVRQIFVKLNSSYLYSKQSGVQKPNDPLDLTFNDYKTAFKSKTTRELIRASLVYALCSSNTLVEKNEEIMKATKKILGKTLFAWVMKLTFYGHFVGGEDEEKTKPMLTRLSSFGVHSILDYSVEEDLSKEEAEKRVSDATIEPESNSLPQYKANKKFFDRRYKVLSARTYFYLNEAACDKNMIHFLRSLEAVSHDTHGFVAIKLTALGRPQLLLQISEVIVQARNYIKDLMGGGGSILQHHFNKEDLLQRLKERGIDPANAALFFQQMTEDQKGIIHLFPWSGIIDSNLELNSTFLVPDLKTGQLVRLIKHLVGSEEQMLRNMIRRVTTVIQAASDLNVSVMIDAEQTYFQPAISRVAMELMRKFNTQRPVVYNTYQCYLQDTLSELKADMEQAERQNFCFGAKIVRGAYLDQERARAAELGYPDPTNPNYEATTEVYHATLRLIFDRVREMKKEAKVGAPRISLVVASHNEDTVRFAIEQMMVSAILPEEGVVSFAQLFGMCDYVTFPLGQSGYAVYKYIPYGPVNEVLPYLSRRVQENKGILKKIKKEKSLIRKELFRRVKTLSLFNKPKGNYKPA